VIILWCVLGLPTGAQYRWLCVSVTVTMITFAQWAKSICLSRQITAILVANLFRNLLLHCMVYLFDPQKSGAPLYIAYTPGVENPSYATDLPVRSWRGRNSGVHGIVSMWGIHSFLWCLVMGASEANGARCWRCTVTTIGVRAIFGEALDRFCPKNVGQRPKNECFIPKCSDFGHFILL